MHAIHRPFGRIALACSLATALWATIAVVVSAGQGTPPPDLTGTWVLDRDASDKPGQPIASGDAPDDRERRPPRGRMGGGGMGGRRGGMGGGMPDRDGMERTRAALDAVMRLPTRLIIVRAAAHLVVTDEDGVSTRLAPDGAKETGAVNGVPFDTSSKWQPDGLRVERTFKGGLKVIERYTVTADPRVLTITTTLDGRRGGRGRTLVRVYQQREPGGF